MISNIRPIKTFSNGQSLEFDWGGFDYWCTFVRNPDGTRNPPRDVDYFSSLVELGQKYGSQKIFSDLKRIFEITGTQIDQPILDHISLVSKDYEGDQIRVEILYSILYATFIAEENKANTKLGKRIKMLGLHQILMEGVTPDVAANFSRGKPWREISALCENRGF